MWFPTKNGKLVKEADEVSSQAYRIAFRADPVAHYRKMLKAISQRINRDFGRVVKRIGKMAVMIQEPGTPNMVPGVDFVVAEYFIAGDPEPKFAVLSHAARPDTYTVDLIQFDPTQPNHQKLLQDYGCVNMFDLMKDSSFPEKIG